MPDAQAVEELVGHRYFQPNITPLQLLNRATDPFLPVVRPHTYAVLEDLDARGLRNHVLVITRHQMNQSDARRLNALHNLKVTLLFTYSGIDDKSIEPYPSSVSAESLRLMSAQRWRTYRTILYWRPLVPGLNDSGEHLDQAHALARHADATVFTGLFYRDEIAAYYQAHGLPEPYEETARRKIVPETLERRVLATFGASTPLFRKTSRAVSHVHGRLPEARSLVVVDVTDRAAIVTGLDSEQPRYYLQHALGFQVHDVRYPHRTRQHGRANIGWKEAAPDD